MASLVTLPNGHLALSSDQVYTIPLIDKDAQGNVVPMPAGDVISAEATGANATSLGVAVNGSSLMLTPLVMESDAGNGGVGIGIALTDTSGLTEDPTSGAVLFDIVLPPPGPAITEGFDLTNVTSVSQAVPTASGP